MRTEQKCDRHWLGMKTLCTYTADIIGDLPVIDNIQSIFHRVVFAFSVLKGFFVAQLARKKAYKRIYYIHLSAIVLVKFPAS